MRLVQVTDPTEYPVTIGEAREQCRVTDSTHDTLISRLIAAATHKCEIRNEMRLASRTMRLDLDGFPSGGADIVFPIYPVVSVSSVSYIDSDDATQTLTEDTGGSPVGDYWKDLNGMEPFLRPVSLWPAFKLYRPASVSITFVAGYANRFDIPEDVRHAILVWVKEAFDVSGETVQGMSVAEATHTFDKLLSLHRRYRRDA